MNCPSVFKQQSFPYLITLYKRFFSTVNLKYCILKIYGFQYVNHVIFCLLEEVEDEVDEDCDIMECDKAQSEEESDDEPSDEAETMTVTSEAPIPADKYDQATNLTEEQETLQKIRGNY